MKVSHIVPAATLICVAAVIPITPVPSFTWASGSASSIRLTGAGAPGSEPDVVIDVIRHGQMISPYENLLTTSPAFPGAPLSDLGQQQAHDVGTRLFNELGPVAGIFEGQGTREMETAAPFAEMENMTGDVQILPGLNEVDSGIYALDPIESLGGRLAFLTVAAWSLGSPLGLAMTPAPGSDDGNGVMFDERFADAMNTMYNAAVANPVVSDNGQITDVAFNSEASIFAWVMMNVKNPDLPYFLQLIQQSHTVSNGLSTVLLPNTGIVSVEGNPADGWTLVSWNGTAIPAEPDLLSGLFVDFRDLVLPTQKALWDIWEVILGGDQATITTAVETGFDQISAAVTGFPESLIDTFTSVM